MKERVHNLLLFAESPSRIDFDPLVRFSRRDVGYERGKKMRITIDTR